MQEYVFHTYAVFIKDYTIWVFNPDYDGEKRVTRLNLLRNFVKKLRLKRKGKFAVYFYGTEVDNSSGMLCNPLTKEWIEKEIVEGQGMLFMQSYDHYIQAGWKLVDM